MTDGVGEAWEISRKEKKEKEDAETSPCLISLNCCKPRLAKLPTLTSPHSMTLLSVTLLNTR